jgi:type II secretory pathway predicted ATPase ExeA
MYTNHFGLERRIFRGNTAGLDVFVGPQTSNVLEGIKKALAAPDAVVTVTGPVGCGKSTAVAHSLGAISGKNAIVRVGRFPLQRGDLVDLLFDHMRIQQRPQRGNQKLALFRALLFNLAKNDSRMLILVEDAPFLGRDMLAELEVITAADTGPSDGAAIVLMGDDYLKELLTSKTLARLRQRIRLRRSLDPFGVEDLGGYLRHCFRQAGSNFDKVFAGSATELLHELSGGILRVVNNLVEASMEAAAETGAANVSLDLVSRIAEEEFGLTGKFTRLPEISSKQPEPECSDDTTAKLIALSMPERQTAADSIAGTDDDDIPELIQDTQPGLAILSDTPATVKPEDRNRAPDTLPDIERVSAELVTETASSGGGPDPDRAPESPAGEPPAPGLESKRVAIKPRDPKPEPKDVTSNAPKPTAQPGVRLKPKSETRREFGRGQEFGRKQAPAVEETIPTLRDEDGAVASPTRCARKNNEIQDWDRESTLAELRPDLAALERAIAIAHGRDPDSARDAEPVDAPSQNEPPRVDTADIPEITLDDSINRKVVIAASEHEKRFEQKSNPEEKNADAGDNEIPMQERARQETSAEELKKMALGLAKAKSIEDVDDKMAETLFGEELSAAAAAVAARVAEEAAAEAAKAGEETAASAPSPKSELDKEFESVWGQTPAVEISIDSEIEDQKGDMELSASQRLATVRALNTGNPGSAPAGGRRSPAAPAAEPGSIEEQITTSLTQTMEALKVNPDPAAINDDDDDDDDDARKGGFFSRFRRP